MKCTKLAEIIEPIVFDGFTRFWLTLLAALNNPFVAVRNPVKALYLGYVAKFDKVVAHENKF